MRVTVRPPSTGITRASLAWWWVCLVTTAPLLAPFTTCNVSCPRAQGFVAISRHHSSAGPGYQALFHFNKFCLCKCLPRAGKIFETNPLRAESESWTLPMEAYAEWRHGEHESSPQTCRALELRKRKSLLTYYPLHCLCQYSKCKMMHRRNSFAKREEKISHCQIECKQVLYFFYFWVKLRDQHSTTCAESVVHLN